MPTIYENGTIKRLSVSEYNKYLASLRSSLNLNADGTIKSYTVEDLGKVWISGMEFTGIAYGGLLTVNTKTYVTEPVRANDGSIPNINDYTTFVVPRCTLNFKYMNIEDYQRVCNAIQSNEFTVKYYDKQFNQFVTHKMYCEPEEMTKLYNLGTSVIGVLDYEVSFIGTLNDLDEYTVKYDGNGGTLLNYVGEYNSATTYKKGDRISLDGKYYEAIWYEDSFSEKAVSDTTYWASRQFSEFSLSATYQKDSIVYKQQNDARRWYIAIYDGTFSERELSNTTYWKSISVSEYDNSTTYYKGQYVATSPNDLYEAIYYKDTFSGIDPTITTHWVVLPVYDGMTVKWGNSIVIEPIENLYEAPNTNVHFTGWKTANGMWYYPNQSANVFNDLTLVAQWE